MEDWAHKTFWVYVDDEGTPALEAVVSDDENLSGIMDEIGVSAVRAPEFGPCHLCPFLDQCMNSKWYEGSRKGGPDTDHLTLVHTCLSCGEVVLTDLPRTVSGIKMDVPKECPRWRSDSGTSLDCETCRLTKALIQSDICEMREADKDRDLLKRARRIVSVLVDDIQRRFDQWDEIADHESDILSIWETGVYASLYYHPEDFSIVTREFILLFNDCPPFKNLWSQMVVPRRNFVERVWAGLVRQA